jgi:hypothetical protein
LPAHNQPRAKSFRDYFLVERAFQGDSTVSSLAPALSSLRKTIHVPVPSFTGSRAGIKLA